MPLLDDVVEAGALAASQRILLRQAFSRVQDWMLSVN